MCVGGGGARRGRAKSFVACGLGFSAAECTDPRGWRNAQALRPRRPAGMALPVNGLTTPQAPPGAAGRTGPAAAVES